MAVPSIHDWRFDPFAESYNAVNKTDEDLEIPGCSPYRVRLNEVPREDSPSSVDCVILVELDEDLDISETAVDVLAAHYDRVQVNDIFLVDSEQMLVTGKPGSPTVDVTRGYGGSTPATHTDGTLMEILDSMTEITSGSPATREFRVDYKYNTGLVLFNLAESGYDVRFDYWGLGSPFHALIISPTNPLIVPASDFMPKYDSFDWDLDYGAGNPGSFLAARTTTTLQEFFAHVKLPQGAKITNMVMYAYKNGATGEITVNLNRFTAGGTAYVNMATCTALDWGDWGMVEDNSIDYPDIDNESYSYILALNLTPTPGVGTHLLNKVLIYWGWS